VSWFERVEWQRQHGAHGFRLGRVDGDVVADWEGIVAVRATERGHLVDTRPDSSAPAEWVRKVLDGAARAFLAFLVRGVSLHASAILHRGRAVVCMGPSGAGKSTVAAFACHLPGVRLLADDTALLARGESYRVLPSEGSVWLASPGDCGSKIPNDAPTATDPGLLVGLVALRFADVASPQLRRLHGAEAAAPVFEALARFLIAPDAQRRELDDAADLAARVPVYGLLRRTDTDAGAVASLLVTELLQ
jgi:hypothetical protein